MDIANLVIRVTSDGLAATTAELRRLREQAADAENRNRRLGSSLDNLKSVAAGLFATVGIAKLGSDLISTQREFDVLNAQLVTATGSSAAAAVEFKKLQDFAKQTPYDLKQAVGGFAQLKNLGLDPSMESMKSFGNTASAMGKDLNQMIEAVADAATGEFERLKEFGIKSKSEGDNVAFTFQGVTTTVKKNAEEITGYLTALGNTQFAGAMAERMDTLDGAFSNLGDSYSNLLLAISSSGAGDGLKGLILDVSAAIDSITVSLPAAKARLDEFFNRADVIVGMQMALGGLKLAWDVLTSSVQAVIDVIAPVAAFFIEHQELSIALAGGIGTVVGAFVLFQGAITVWVAVSALATTATAAFGVAVAFLSSPITLTILAIGALVAAGIYLYRNWDEIKAKATEIWGNITSYIGAKIDSIVGFFQSNFPAMTAIVSGAFNIIKSLFTSAFALIKNTVSTVLGVIKAIISGDFKAIPGIIGNGLKSAITIVGNLMGQILSTIKDAGAKLFSIGKDFIQGFINGIKSAGSGVVSAASSMVGGAIAAVKRTQDSASPSKVTTKLGGDFSQGMANGIKKGSKAVNTEAQRMVENAIDATKNSIASLQKDIALFGNDSLVASFDFDVSVGKYAGVPQSLLDSNRELIVQKQTLIDLDKQQTESAKALAKSTESIQARFSKLAEDRDASKKAVDGVMGEIKQESPLDKLQSDYDRRLEVITKNEMLETGIMGSMAAERLAIEQNYQDAKQNLMLTQSEALFGNLAGLAKGFAGEQSGIYKALFAVEKGFAIAQSAIAIQQSIAKAMAVGFPANIPLIGQAVSQGMGIMSSIKSITAGFKQGGYTGNGGAGQVAGVVHGQEYVFDAQSTKRIGVDNLNAMRSGKAVGGGDVSINIVNNSSAKVTASNDGQTITIDDVRNEVKRSWGNTGNPNSFESKQLNRNIQAPRRR